MAELYKVHFLHFYPPSLPTPKLNGWDIKVGCWTVTRHIKSMIVKAKVTVLRHPRVRWADTALREAREAEQQPRAGQGRAVLYVPCVPGAGRCSRQQHSWSGQLWRRTWAARGHRQHTRSCPPRSWHRRSANKHTLELHHWGSMHCSSDNTNTGSKRAQNRQPLHASSRSAAALVSWGVVCLFPPLVVCLFLQKE